MNSNNGVTCVCSRCRSEIMLEDAVEVKDRVFCATCVARLVDEDSIARPVKVSTRKISRFLLFMFSFVPGANYMYMGMMTRGLYAMSLFFLLSTMGIFIPLPIVYFYCLFDSFEKRRTIIENTKIYDIS